MLEVIGAITCVVVLLVSALMLAGIVKITVEK
jgi:hypothetical protein